jgi:hypothetical protein
VPLSRVFPHENYLHFVVKELITFLGDEKISKVKNGLLIDQMVELSYTIKFVFPNFGVLYGQGQCCCDQYFKL